MATTVKMMAGRRWKRSNDGKDTVTNKYVIQLDSAIAAGDEGDDITGIPALGADHPQNDKLCVASVEYEEQTVGQEKILIATVSYEPKESTTQTTASEGGVVYQVDEWGWDASTESRDLLQDVTTVGTDDPKMVVNSAGDPYDSAPQVAVPAPVFTKTMKFASRQSGALDYNCKVNDTAITIGDKSCPIGSLLCSVTEKRIFGDKNWNYVYTVQLHYKSQPVKVFGDNTTTDIGWDVAVADTGMRQKDPNDETGKKKVIIRVLDEAGVECQVSSPALLDGNGYAISPTDEDQSPRNLRFKAYQRASFPGWFYSEPPIVNEDDDE